MDPQQPVTEVGTLAQVRADNRASPRLTALLLGTFAIRTASYMEYEGKGWMRSDG